MNNRHEQETNEMKLNFFEFIHFYKFMERDRYRPRNKFGYYYLLDEFDADAEELLKAERRNRDV